MAVREEEGTKLVISEPFINFPAVNTCFRNLELV